MDKLIRWVLLEEAKKTDLSPEEKVRLLIRILTIFLSKVKD